MPKETNTYKYRNASSAKSTINATRKVRFKGKVDAVKRVLSATKKDLKKDCKDLTSSIVKNITGTAKSIGKTASTAYKTKKVPVKRIINKHTPVGALKSLKGLVGDNVKQQMSENNLKAIKRRKEIIDSRKLRKQRATRVAKK